MKDITVKELLNKKVELEVYLIDEITKLLLKFQKETGCDIKDIKIMMKDVYDGMFYHVDEKSNLRYFVENVEADVELEDF